MEKLILIFLINEPNHGMNMNRFETVSETACYHIVEQIRTDKTNPIVYHDSEGAVYRYAATCVSRELSGKLIPRVE
jgi:hypothetical protein